MLISGNGEDAITPLTEARIGWAEAAQRAGGDGRSDQKNTRHLLQTELALAEAYLVSGDPAAAKTAADRARDAAEAARSRWPDSEQIKAFETEARDIRARCLESLGTLKN